jgi:hypothetical protein
VVTRPAAALAALASLPFALPAARGDTVEMKNGRVLEGQVLEETADAVTVKLDGGQVTFPKSLVREIRRSTAPPPAAPGAAAGPAAAPAAPLLPASLEEWSALWAGDRRAGWRRASHRSEAEGWTFEEESAFLGEDGKVATRVRTVEESGPSLEPRGFLHREEGSGVLVQRSGKVSGGRLVVETIVRGKVATTDHPLPPGFRLPAAARALVLREGTTLPGGWKGTTYDPARGEFVELALRVDRAERLAWEGAAVEVTVLERQRGGVREEERVAAGGSVLSSEINGPALVAVRTSRARAEALQGGKDLPATEEELRARSAFASAADGFRVYKPGAAWEFVPGGRGAATLLRVRDVGGLAFVEIVAETVEPGRPLEALGADLEARLRAGSAEFRKLEDGFGTLDGRRSFRLLCDARLKGDLVRTLCLVAVKDGRAWTLTASCPAGLWESARPSLERILGSFEWM